MEVLALNRQIFILFWILPVPHNGSKWIKLRNISIGSFNCIILIGTLISSGYFVYEFILIDLERSLYAIFQMTTSCSEMYMLVFSFIFWRKYAEIFPKLQQMYDGSKFKVLK